MRGLSKPISFIASSPSSIVRRIRPLFNSHARRRGMCVVTWIVHSRSLASSMRDSVAPHSSAMYSVCPENGRPPSATASLFNGAVTIASASPRKHISVATRTNSTAAAPHRASSLPNSKLCGIDRIVHRPEFRRSQTEPGDLLRHLHHTPIAQDDPVSHTGQRRICQRLENHFGTDPGRVSHRECDRGQLCHRFEQFKVSAISIRASGPPNAPDLVTTSAPLSTPPR